MKSIVPLLLAALVAACAHGGLTKGKANLDRLGPPMPIDSRAESTPDEHCFVPPLVTRLTEKVYFNYGSSSLGKQSRRPLDAMVMKMRGLPDNTYVEVIILSGYADRSGDAYRNRLLTQRRERAVKDYFATNGVPDNLLYERGGVDTSRLYPKTAIKSRKEQALDRRAEIEVSLVEDRTSLDCRREDHWPNYRVPPK